MAVDGHAAPRQPFHRTGPSSQAWPHLFLILFFAAGCARLMPRPIPLAEDERALVLSRYREYLQPLPLCSGIEADVNLQYQSILKDARIPGVLLAKSPASLKVMGLSPLGQPLLLFSLHNGRFTLIDVHGQKGFTGSISASKVKSLLPLEKLTETGLYALLTGGPAIPVEDQLVVSRLPEEGQGRYLLSWTGGRTAASRWSSISTPARWRPSDCLMPPVGFSWRSATVLKREERCGVPAALNISGSKVRGTVECSFEKVFPADSLAASEFALSVPEGFTMEEVR